MIDAERTSLVVGAENIAAALNISRAQFYKARHAGGLRFVWQEPGLGLITTKFAAARYLENRAAGKSADESATSAPIVSAA